MPLVSYGQNATTGLGGIEQAKNLKLQDINAICEKQMAGVTATYPPSELLTFDKQEQEARAYIADPNSPTPLLSSLATTRGIELDFLVQLVLIKADAFAEVSGKIVGLRQKLEDKIKSAKTMEEVNAIVWLE